MDLRDYTEAFAAATLQDWCGLAAFFVFAAGMLALMGTIQ